MLVSDSPASQMEVISETSLLKWRKTTRPDEPFPLFFDDDGVVLIPKVTILKST